MWFEECVLKKGAICRFTFLWCPYIFFKPPLNSIEATSETTSIGNLDPNSQTTLKPPTSRVTSSLHPSWASTLASFSGKFSLISAKVNSIKAWSDDVDEIHIIQKLTGLTSLTISHMGDIYCFCTYIKKSQSAVMVTYIIRWKPHAGVIPTQILWNNLFFSIFLWEKTHSQATPLNCSQKKTWLGGLSRIPRMAVHLRVLPRIEDSIYIYIQYIHIYFDNHRKGVDFPPAMLDDFISHAMQTNLLEIRTYCKNCSGNHRSFAPLNLPANPEKSRVNHMIEAKY